MDEIKFRTQILDIAKSILRTASSSCETSPEFYMKDPHSERIRQEQFTRRFEEFMQTTNFAFGLTVFPEKEFAFFKEHLANRTLLPSKPDDLERFCATFLVRFLFLEPFSSAADPALSIRQALMEKREYLCTLVSHLPKVLATFRDKVQMYHNPPPPIAMARRQATPAQPAYPSRQDVLRVLNAIFDSWTKDMDMFDDTVSDSTSLSVGAALPTASPESSQTSPSAAPAARQPPGNTKPSKSVKPNVSVVLHRHVHSHSLRSDSSFFSQPRLPSRSSSKSSPSVSRAAKLSSSSPVSDGILPNPVSTPGSAPGLLPTPPSPRPNPVYWPSSWALPAPHPHSSALDEHPFYLYVAAVLSSIYSHSQYLPPPYAHGWNPPSPVLV